MQYNATQRGTAVQVIATSKRPLLLRAAASLAVCAAGLGIAASPAVASTPRTSLVPAQPTAWALESPGGSTALVGIDVATDAVVSTIALPNSIGTNVGGTAGALAITPNGKKAYLAVEFAREVVPIDLSTKIIGKAIKVGNQAVSVAVTPNGSRVYELGYVDVQHANVVAISTSDGKTSKAVSVGPLESAGPGGIAITPNGATVWVSSPENATVTPISTSTGKAGKPVTVGAFPTSLAVTPNGRTLWVANSEDDDLLPVDLADSKVGTRVKLGGAPIDLSITPNGEYAFASLGSPANGADRVTLSGSHRVSKIKLVDATRVALQVDASAVDPAGGRALFCGAAEGTIAAVDVAAARESRPITLSTGVSSVSAIAITPDQAPKARFSVTVSGREVHLNASSSTAWFGSIARYSWSFGDKASSVGGPVTSHTYAKNGKYAITLVVTDSLGTSTSVVFTGQTVSRNGGPSARKSTTVEIS